MKYKLVDNKIILLGNPSNLKNGLKIYFYRECRAGEKHNDYPVCYTDTIRKIREYEWIKGLKILGGAIKRRKWIFFTYWEVLEEESY